MRIFAKTSRWNFFLLQKRSEYLVEGNWVRCCSTPPENGTSKPAFWILSENAPARLACDHFTKGDLTDFQAVYDFGKKVDVLTIEIEKVNVKALEKLEREGVKVYPQPHVLETIQNKCLQKKFYKSHNIPTASFEEFETLDQVKEAVIKGGIVFSLCMEIG